MSGLDEVGKLLVQGSLTGGIGGLLVYLLTLPQRRRKIDAGATVEEATAASTLSGEALRWVDEARTEARQARADAVAAQTQAAAARRDSLAVEERFRALLEIERNRVDDLERRERDLEDVIRDLGGTVPKSRRAYDVRPAGTRSVGAASDPPQTGASP